jgi:hypothetical protein
MYALILSAYSPNMAKYFPHILHRRTYSILPAYSQNMQNEIFTACQQCLAKLKGQYFEKIELGIINWPTMNKANILYFDYL